MNDRKRFRRTPQDVDPAFDDELPDEIEIEAAQAEDDGGAFHDPVLRRALLHAPDHAVLPMEETRESILAFAHEAVAPSLPAAPIGAQRGFLLRALGMRGGAGFTAHIPWNLLYAAALVGGVATVWDWQHKREAEMAMARNDTAALPDATVAPTPAVPQPSQPSAPPESLLQPQADAQSAVGATAVAPSAQQPAIAAANTPASAAVPPSSMPAPTIALPVVESPEDAEARIALEQRLQRLEAAEARARLTQQSDAKGLPSSLFASALPRTAIPVEVPLAARAGRPAPGQPATPVSTASSTDPVSASAAAASPARAEEAPSPTFTALSQWTRLTITSPGAAPRRIARADTGELGPLVGSAALAGVGPQPLSGRVEWRIALERNGEQLGLLEVTGTQVRWKENGIPAGTGTPSASAMASLRQALKEVQTEPVKPAGPTSSAAPLAPNTSAASADLPAPGTDVAPAVPSPTQAASQ